MKFKPIKTSSTTDIFVNQLKNAILTGEYSVGDKLPSERDLAQQMQVSLNVINSGLKRLNSLHFVTIKPRHGAYIADFRTEGNLVTLNEIINFYEGHYRRSLVKSFLQVRKTIEADMINLAFQNMTTEDLQQMHYILAAMQFKNKQDMPYATFTFIQQLSLASKNQVYPLLINNFKSVYITLGIWLCNEVGAAHILKRNQGLFQLIKAKKEKEAIAYNNQSIKATYQILTKVD